jgi:hypothetical protein
MSLYLIHQSSLLAKRKNYYRRLPAQGRIKGFVGTRHFSSLSPFGDSKSIVGTTVYSRLAGLMEGEGMHR